MGVFINDFRPDACTWQEHVAARAALYKTACGDDKRRKRPFRGSFDVLERGGHTFYHPEGLRVLLPHVEQPAFLRTIVRFLERADHERTLIWRPGRAPRPYVPPAEREHLYGRVCRGPAWSPEEDAVLRRWFGRRTVGPHAGRHTTLTDDEWARVLAELPQRNKASVRGRIVVLNKQLKATYLRDGYLSLDRVPDYMNHVLGERPITPIRPRRKRRP